MGTVEEALQAQVRNIEATYGRPINGWIDVVRESGKAKHGEIVAMLKAEHGMTHGSANRVALIARDALASSPSPTVDPADELYAGKKAPLRPIHDGLLAAILALGRASRSPPRKAT